MQVLSDPNRRRQYDLSGGDEEAKGADYQPVDMEGIGNVGSVPAPYLVALNVEHLVEVEAFGNVRVYKFLFECVLLGARCFV